MQYLRIIPSLLLSKGKLVKGKNFINHKNVGSPVTTVNAFDSQKADEIFIIDLDSYKNGISQDYKSLKEISKISSTPITFGGGIKNIEDIKMAFTNGADKIFLNSILFNNPDIVNLTGNIYGNQSIIGGVNINYSNDKYFLLEDKTRKIDPLEHVNYLEKIGVAEIKITYVHLEGTKNGIDIDYSKKIKETTSLPCIFEGGIGNLKHLENFFLSGLQSIALGTILNFSDHNIIKIKKNLIEKNFSIRI